MEQVRLGQSGVSVSRIVLGAMALGSVRHDEARRLATMRAALDAGITSIDTAPLYDFGRSEELVGQLIVGCRQQVQILTKVGLRWDDPSEHGKVLFDFRDADGKPRAVRRNSRPESIRMEVERSLQRLRVETLDLVQVHHPDYDTPIAETMGALSDLQLAGKLRAIGVSNYTPEQMAQAERALGTIPLVSNQVSYSLLERSIERDVLPYAREHRIGVLAYSPLAQGLLSDRFRPEALARDDGRRTQPRAHPRNVERIQETVASALKPVAARLSVNVSQVALAWLLAQHGITGVIAGASSPEQAQQNAAAAALTLRSEELHAIRAAFEALHIDRHAGRSPLERAQRRAREIAGSLRRRLLGA